MSNTLEPIQKESPSRRKFVLSVAVLSAFAAVLAAVRIPFPGKKNKIACAPESKKKMVKMLTQDGRLVEIDEALLNANRKKITNTELQHWIKK
jgi:nicotinic acid mononucleotide adenylyltransferase